MLVDLAIAISFFLTLFSLLTLFHTAFFLLGTTWEERLIACVTRVLVTACTAFASGLLFRNSTDPAVPLWKTLPVRVFLWTLVGILVLFPLAWYLDVYYVPLTRRGHYL